MLTRILTIAATLLSATTCINAQSAATKDAQESKHSKHIDLGLTAGTTGIGFDITAVVNKNIKVRAGFTMLPCISLSKDYSMASEGEVGKDIDDTEKERRINNLVGYLNDMVGDTTHTQVDKYVTMSHRVKFSNAHVLVDWYPFKEKHWHFTAGLYFGPKRIGKAINAQSESNTMIAINLYNNMYEQIQGLDEWEYPSFKFGRHSYEMDPKSGAYMKDAFNIYGRAAVRLGTLHDGTPYYITPDNDGILQAEAQTNVFKPYIGFGWQTNIGYDKRWSVGFNAGALYWGTPHVYYTEGDGKRTCLVHDVENIGGQVGSYFKLLKNFVVYPSLELNLAYTIF